MPLWTAVYMYIYVYIYIYIYIYIYHFARTIIQLRYDKEGVKIIGKINDCKFSETNILQGIIIHEFALHGK